ncbi:extracellular solute-binding protein [uncultured Ruegeria sp.]|uniref:extracellular solute-binding protein n=1 Tax=uncultured Ruegeria sp. TaxID=259304 RepID=UPI0026031FC5|nr:extracellular solute-binding protein [uncultured Ruegeria sp.]
MFSRFIISVTIICFALLPAFGARAETRKALVIGVGEYESVRSLNNPANDARDVQATFTRLGFETTILIDPDAASVTRKLIEFEADAENAEIALIYFAGHGISIGGQSYLLSSDARIDDTIFGSNPVSEFVASLLSTGADLKLLILDACRNDPFAGDPGKSSRGLVAANPGLLSGQVSNPDTGVANLVVAYSAAPGAVAYDGEGGNSPFTSALVGLLENGKTEVNDLFLNVRRVVHELSGGNQVPWIEGSLIMNFDLARNDQIQSEAPSVPLSLETRLLNQAAKFQEKGAKVPVENMVRRLAKHYRSDNRRVAGSTLSDLELHTPEDVALITWLSARRSSDTVQLNELRLQESTPKDIVYLTDQSLSAIETNALPDIEHLQVELSTNQTVALQSVLSRTGDYALQVDGDFGSNTQRALDRYRLRVGITPVVGVTRLDLVAMRPDISKVLTETTNSEIRKGLHELGALGLNLSGGQPEVIRWRVIDASTTIDDFWDSIGRRFENENPGLMVQRDALEFPLYKRQMLGDLASSDAPDVFFTWGNGQLRSLVEVGLVSDVLDGQESAWLFEVLPAAMSNYIFGNRIFGVPSRLETTGFWMREGLSMDNLLTDNLRDAGNAKLAIGASADWMLQMLWSNFALSIAGPSVMSQFIEDPEEVAGDASLREATQEFLNFLHGDLVEHSSFDRPQHKAIEAFATGEADGVFAGSFSLPTFWRFWHGGQPKFEEEAQFVPFAKLDERFDENLSVGSSPGWAMHSTGSSYSNAFLNFLTRADIQKSQMEAIGSVPILFVLSDTALEVGQEAISKHLYGSDYHLPYPDQSLGIDAGLALNSLIKELAYGRISIDDFLLELAQL